MANPTPEQRRLTSEKVIVYDPICHSLTLEEAVKHKGGYSG